MVDRVRWVTVSYLPFNGFSFDFNFLIFEVRFLLLLMEAPLYWHQKPTLAPDHFMYLNVIKFLNVRNLLFFRKWL